MAILREIGQRSNSRNLSTMYDVEIYKNEDCILTMGEVVSYKSNEKKTCLSRLMYHCNLIGEQIVFNNLKKMLSILLQITFFNYFNFL